MPAPGPAALGRGVVVTSRASVPDAWARCPVVVVDEDALTRPGMVVAELHDGWLRRRPMVVLLSVAPERFRAPASWKVDAWALPASFEPWLDRLHFLVWANTYDARLSGPPVWWWARKAERAGATISPQGPADIVLPDGRPAWVDGGPRGPLARSCQDYLSGRLPDASSILASQAALAPTLAPDQTAAVTHGAGPARVIAPAGSGKTRVLTERLRYLMDGGGFEREGVLAVAYNKKAQLEIEQRCSSFRPRVQTLNALGFGLLAQSRGRAPRVLDEREVRQLLARLVPRQPRRLNTDPLGPYIEALSSVRLGLRSPAEVEESRDDVPGLATAFAPYREQLAEGGAIDFDEQVYGAIEALLVDGELRRRAQSGCRHLLVDEFQDLTPAHMLLLRLLAAPGLDVFGVGDDDQVIYGHAGADPTFLLDFGQLFPGACEHPLQVSYRCPVPVVEATLNLLSWNERRVVKDILPGPGVEQSPAALSELLHPPGAAAIKLRELVSGWLAGPGVTPEDIAVLTRVNSLLLAPYVVLAEAGVPVGSALRQEVLNRTGVRAALAYLRIASHPDDIDAADVVEVYRRPSRGLPQWFPKWLHAPLSLDKLLAIGRRIDDPKVGAKLADLVADLKLVVDAVQRGTTASALAVVKDQIGLGRAMGMLDSSGAGEGSSGHLDDLEALEQVAHLHHDAPTFGTWLRGALRPSAPGGVTLSTVHRVKGREWDRVVVFGATAGLFPHRLATDVEEERRVMHVAITRGRRAVTILADASRPSPFLAELHSRRAPGGGAVRPPGSEAERPKGRISSGQAGGAADRRGAPRSAGTAAAALSPEAEKAVTALRAWRLERSRTDKVPAYIVLADRYLTGIAASLPRSLEELRRLPGIGPTKLESYGEEILAVLEASQ
ncbi:MAG: ATP-dependent DNA helicase UvrD2 [Acidimicrobiales bacterium]